MEHIFSSSPVRPSLATGTTSESPLKWTPAEDRLDTLFNGDLFLPGSPKNTYEIPALGYDWEEEICGTSVPLQGWEQNQHTSVTSGGVGPIRSPRRSSRLAGKVSAPYEVPTPTKAPPPLVSRPKRRANHSKPDSPPSVGTSRGRPTVSLPQKGSATIAKKPNGKARASPSSAKTNTKPKRKSNLSWELTLDHIKLMGTEQEMQCPWPHCGASVPLNQGSLTKHIKATENKKTHVKNVERAECPLGCTGIYYNVSKHIIQQHAKVIVCNIDGCKSEISGGRNQMKRHLTQTAIHSDLKEPARGCHFEFKEGEDEDEEDEEEEEEED
ncbi:hypothetical protein NLI96_g10834 [Meripilus lineatus]|uniref:Uncharacterized protein n=1 Tax=Meripilus lineatus TaxID=2056292 RepID=A0AAD5USV8_9APHY|nr:hypothetical protein NLI96_g10834 [Physisporinus lineatus]